MDALNKFAPNAHWLLRLALIGPFAFHGLGKFMMPAAGAEMLGLPVAIIILVGIVEVGGSLILLAGSKAKDWMVRLTGLGFTGTMIGAIIMFHAPNGWSSLFGANGMEFQVTLTLVSLYFVVVGNQAEVED